ncbi:hypothetical protein Geob_0972 [Geotalea daltonii FRC-32]|uniref:Sn-glycerol-3-phosphate transporter n=1 Tax=Geotalea daltonii (strain DSM 22248 / JCM 15807 / FRC-32) TaxID=316067 RepID=B9M2F5_GEODF|nr:hypothetical protein [Geotalea daltonii]ACM19334.1 hypothetical protein Geob_0972 [Geotalea daltonii FRC-32]
MRSVLLCFHLVFIFGTFHAKADVFGDGDLLQLNFGPYIYHYSSTPGRNSYPWYTGLEWESASRWELGGAIFSNSYYQPSGYLYGGKRFIYGSESRHLFLKITAGAILGYVPPHEDKIPVNKNGLGLGIIPAIGYKHGRTSIQIAILSTSALMLNIGYDIWR